MLALRQDGKVDQARSYLGALRGMAQNDIKKALVRVQELAAEMERWCATGSLDAEAQRDKAERLAGAARDIEAAVLVMAALHVSAEAIGMTTEQLAPDVAYAARLYRDVMDHDWEANRNGHVLSATLDAVPASVRDAASKLPETP